MYYSTYAAARAAANPNTGDHDLIQIRANLNESIILKNGVDIWIMDGITLDYDLSNPSNTIFDNNVEFKCSIYGGGILKNSYIDPNPPFRTRYSCIFINNANSELSVECDYIEAEGGPLIGTNSGASVQVVSAKKFELTCNKVYNGVSEALFLGNGSFGGFINYINVNVKNLLVGTDSPPADVAQAFGVKTYANGFINVDEIKCNHHGNCILHFSGDITAKVIKATTINDVDKFDGTIIVKHGSAVQKLVLYFDEINAFKREGTDSGPGVDIGEGTSYFIGRKILSQKSFALSTQGNSAKSTFRCNEMISEDFLAIQMVEITECKINCNLIQGKEGAVIYSSGSSSVPGSCSIKNATIKNIRTSDTRRGIYILNVYPKLTLNNVQIISDNESVFIETDSTIDVYNYGFFGKNDVSGYVDLKIGIKYDPADPNFNYLYIIDPLV